MKIERSKVAKPFREAEFTILFDYGLDDLSSMIDYLYGSKEINFDNQNFDTRKQFIRYIEKNNLEHRLIEQTKEKWNAIENAFALEVKQRKQRYDK